MCIVSLEVGLSGNGSQEDSDQRDDMCDVGDPGWTQKSYMIRNVTLGTEDILAYSERVMRYSVYSMTWVTLEHGLSCYYNTAHNDM